MGGGGGEAVAVGVVGAVGGVGGRGGGAAGDSVGGESAFGRLLLPGLGLSYSNLSSQPVVCCQLCSHPAEAKSQKQQQWEEFWSPAAVLGQSSLPSPGRPYNWKA